MKDLMLWNELKIDWGLQKRHLAFFQNLLTWIWVCYKVLIFKIFMTWPQIGIRIIFHGSLDGRPFPLFIRSSLIVCPFPPSCPFGTRVSGLQYMVVNPGQFYGIASTTVLLFSKDHRGPLSPTAKIKLH